MDLGVIVNSFEEVFTCFLINFVLVAHTLLDFFLTILKAWNVAPEIVVPEVPHAIRAVFKLNASKLIARGDSTP